MGQKEVLMQEIEELKKVQKEEYLNATIRGIKQQKY